MYESPIEKIYGEFTSQIQKHTEQEEEKLVYSISQEIGYRIDKQELIHALNYDRYQYKKVTKMPRKIY